MNDKIFSFFLTLFMLTPAFSDEQSPYFFSGYYNIARQSFEARWLPKDRLYFAFVPSIIADGYKNGNNSDAVFPNLHVEQAYSVYGYLKLIEVNKYTDLAGRAGCEIQDLARLSNFFYFSEFGIRLKINPIERWVFDLSTYPIQYSFLTYRDASSISVLEYSNMNFGLEYLF